jgi:hypothetical protein
MQEQKNDNIKRKYGPKIKLERRIGPGNIPIKMMKTIIDDRENQDPGHKHEKFVIQGF